MRVTVIPGYYTLHLISRRRPTPPAPARPTIEDMITASELTKRYGGKPAKYAVSDLTFTVRPGTVTGFLGPNGAGKSTTMRMILGLDAPTRGTATVGNHAYADHPAPSTRSAHSWRHARSTRAARPTTTWSRSPSPTASPGAASTTSWTSPA